MCRAFNEVPIALKLSNDKVVLELGTEIKKSEPKETLIVKANKFERETGLGSGKHGHDGFNDSSVSRKLSRMSNSPLKIKPDRLEDQTGASS
jgi:hypothetical protein